MKTRDLTGPWAGFSLRRGKLVSPEGHEFGPEDLRWLSLTVGIKQEWCRMMEAEKCRRRRPADPQVIYLREILAGARARCLSAAARPASPARPDAPDTARRTPRASAAR